MANIKSAIKRIEVTKRNTDRNKKFRTQAKSAMRDFEKTLEAGNVDEARELLKTVDKKLKVAANKNVISKKSASRKISSLAKKLNK
ncbi:30S ribosomal protein S20 [Peptoniphilus obesi]|uniref:30S ribosomal protein S20 n=1 Tax=Peptoniphilus obesi TaxID=1472765 RepID=UPI0004B91075|nr:30S ribosomal protein S20 [Peptoniphilus obesi]